MYAALKSCHKYFKFMKDLVSILHRLLILQVNELNWYDLSFHSYLTLLLLLLQFRQVK